jgi:hypothetical protein
MIREDREDKEDRIEDKSDSNWWSNKDEILPMMVDPNNMNFDNISAMMRAMSIHTFFNPTVIM